MITLTQVRALLALALTHTKNPAIMRLADLTVEGLALAYLPQGVRVLVTIPAGRVWPEQTYAQTASLVTWLAEPTERSALDLTDPGTAHALLVALALALGLDPGVGGLGVAWIRTGPFETWRVVVHHTGMYFVPRGSCADEILAPTVAAEPDPIKALGLAVLHVLPATSSTG